MVENEILTPQKIEKRLYDLSKQIDEAHRELIDAESDYYEKKYSYEMELAKTRLRYAHPDHKMTIAMREDRALVENEILGVALNIAEVRVRAARANAKRIETQVEITRSLGTSVRASMEIV